MEDACGYDVQSPANFNARVSDAPPQETKKAKKRERDVQKAIDMVHDPVNLFTRPFATEDLNAAAKAREHIEECGVQIAKEAIADAAEAKEKGKRKLKKNRTEAQDKNGLAKTLGDFLTEECYVDLEEVTVDSLIEGLPKRQQDFSMLLKSRMEEGSGSLRAVTSHLRRSASRWRCRVSCTCAIGAGCCVRTGLDLCMAKVMCLSKEELA